MKLKNSLTNKIEEFEPINPPNVKVYTCGPTVYSFPTIGNYRTYTTVDFLVKALKYLGYKTEYVMNLTDVGHLTGDNLGDADTGEDRLQKAAKAERKTAWDIAQFYGDDFIKSFDLLNLTEPKIFAKATDHIQDQISLIQEIEAKGFTYKILDGIYFDVKKYEEAGNKYGELSTLDQIKAGARVEPNPDKHDSRDFALWKFSPDGAKRDMEWDSPWGKGFPGWHIECSAMSMKYLGEQFDIHTGGEDLRSTHHPNEIAQSEAATGKKPFVKYWMHVAFLMVDGMRMGKSLGNAYTLHDLENKGDDLMALRYFYLTGHYSKQLNFTFEALEAANNSLQKLRAQMQRFRKASERTVLSAEKLEKANHFQDDFKAALGDDLNMPQALSVVWETFKSNIPDYDKYDLIRGFDEVLGLRLDLPAEKIEITDEIKALLQKREELRKQGNFTEADKIREELIKKGHKVNDTSTA